MTSAGLSDKLLAPVMLEICNFYKTTVFWEVEVGRAGVGRDFFLCLLLISGH